MGREERILRRIYPEKGAFSESEWQLAREILMIADGKTEKASSLPRRFVMLGDVLEFRGRRYRCVLRDEVHWIDCCRGCAFQGGDCPSFLQCSKFDRQDGRNVWFEEI